jgi:N-dimethylarginine dimethylaminohydrolase
VVGHGIRTSAEFVSELGLRLPGLVTGIKLVDKRFYHLDTCYFYHSNGDCEVCWYYPGAFAGDSLQALRALIAEMEIDAYEVTEAEAATLCCNSVGIGPSVIASSLSEKLRQYVTERGFTAHETPLSEFNKAGGSARCLILRVPRCALTLPRRKAAALDARIANCSPALT